MNMKILSGYSGCLHIYVTTSEFVHAWIPGKLAPRQWIDNTRDDTVRLLHSRWDTEALGSAVVECRTSEGVRARRMICNWEQYDEKMCIHSKKYRGYKKQDSK